VPVYLWIGDTLSLLVRNPVVIKSLFFPFFVSIVVFAANYLVDFIKPYFAGSPIYGLASYVGIFDGMAIYFTIIISAFGVKQVLRFISS